MDRCRRFREHSSKFGLYSHCMQAGIGPYAYVLCHISIPESSEAQKNLPKNSAAIVAEYLFMICW